MKRFRPALRDIGQVAEERRRGHGEGGAFSFDDVGGFLGVPDILKHVGRAQPQCHHEAVHEAGLVRHRRGHQDDVVAIELEPFRVRDDVGEECVGGVHRAFRLAGRAGGIDDLHDLVRIGADEIIGSILVQEQVGEVRLPFPADDADVAQRRQIGAQGDGHSRMVEAAEDSWYHQQLTLGESEHETQFALAEDGHEGIGDRADPQRGEM